MPRSTRSPTRCGRSRPQRSGHAAGVGRGRTAAACALLALRERCLKLGAELPWAERGAILTLLGSAERAFYLIERIDAERRSVSRAVPAAAAAAAARRRSAVGRRSRSGLDLRSRAVRSAAAGGRPDCTDTAGVMSARRDRGVQTGGSVPDASGVLRLALYATPVWSGGCSPRFFISAAERRTRALANRLGAGRRLGNHAAGRDRLRGGFHDPESRRRTSS